MRQQNYLILLAIVIVLNIPFPVGAQAPPTANPATRIIVADILMIDGDFYVVRGDRGEIRIEVTPDTKVSEEFKFGDRIKAVVRPNDSAISIERAGEGDVVGIITQDPVPMAPSSNESKIPPKDMSSISEKKEPVPDAKEDESESTTRIVVADILMVDGDFYVVRTEFGEIQIEVTPDTKLEKTFKFGDRIKAHILPNDKAISVSTANPDEPIGVVTAKQTPDPGQPPSQAIDPKKPKSEGASAEATVVAKTPKTRTIVAEILMIDGDFYVVRGERGEVRIEVTPDTKLSEEFKFGDKIKAKVLSTDEAISIERAQPNEPMGITDSE